LPVSSAAGLPTGTVTFLFTDIEGSTRLLKQLRDGYAAVLVEHERIIRAALAEHDGWEIDTQGDSFFAAFRRAKDAVGAALAAQRALAANEWPDGVELRVRMGMHTGEPVVGGERYVGLGVHRAARISAAGHGGQVLVSQTTRELLRDDPLPDVTLRDLGEHQLKDLDEPERIYQLVAPGLADEFPPLKTGAPMPFEGREGELVEAAQETVDEMSSPWLRKRRLLVGAGALVLVALAVLLGIALTRGGTAVASGEVAPNDVGLVDAKSGKVSAQIPVGHAPAGVAAASDATWVTNSDENSVSRIDPKTNDVRQTIPVGGSPSGIAVGANAVWVANGLDGTLSRIAPGTNQVVQTITVGNGPVAVAYGGGAVWVANAADGTISQVDPQSGHVRRTIPASNGVSAIAFGSGRLWVVAGAAGMLLALDPDTGAIVDRIGVGVDPDAVTTGAGAVWVANRGDGTVSRVDARARTVTDQVNVGRNPSAIAFGEGAVWVANSGGSTLSKIDPATARVVKTVRLSNSPRGLAVTRDGVYVAVRTTGLSHRGGTLRIVSSSGLDFLDPALSYSPVGWSILSSTNDGLVGFRRVGGIQGIQLAPDLAVALPVAGNGGRTYTFRLRRDLRYSDGKPIQPADFRRAIERVFEVKPPDSPAIPYFIGIVGAAKCKGKTCDLSRGIVGDPVARTVTFRLVAPDPDFLTKLAMPFADAVPVSTPARDLEKHPVPATGPYMVASYVKNKLVKLVRNPNFHEWSTDAQPEGYPDVISWNLTDDGHVGLRTVEHGSADAALGLVPPLSKAELDELATRYPGQLRLSTTPITNYFFLNTRVRPFDDLRVRVAVNYAFDRQAFGALLGRAWAPTCQILPPNYPSFRRTCPYLPNGVAGLDKARRLVRASGTVGQPVTVWGSKNVVVQGRFMTSVLRSLGYRARLHVVKDPEKYFMLATDSRTRMQTGYYGWGSDFPSESSFIKSQFACSSFVPASPFRTTDPSEFCDRSIDRLLDHALSVQGLDASASHTLWQDAEAKILALAPTVPTSNRQNVDLVSARVGNYQYHPQWGALVDQLWVR
jgi:peptide/nickel transport system substrate-binding protein